MEPFLRSATPEDAPLLSELAIRSKAWWGYSQSFMAACIEELTVDPRSIDEPGFYCVVAQHGSTIQGFYILEDQHERSIELGALFVDPPWIGKGVGRMLIEHAIANCREKGLESLEIQGDPHAEKFYLATGASRIGERQSSSIPGRYLPVFRIDLSAERRKPA